MAAALFYAPNLSLQVRELKFCRNFERKLMAVGIGGGASSQPLPSLELTMTKSRARGC
jgi:hypothetical protein